MMERFAGKVAVVTGASGGIGSAIVKELLKFKITVVGVDINTRTLKVLEEEVLKNTQDYTGKFFAKKCDVSDEKEVQKIFQWIHENLKTISILINNAGVLILSGQNGLVETFDSTFEINCKGTLLFAREAANSMIKNSEPGHIINISSIGGYEKNYSANIALYSATKHAVRIFSDTLRQEILKKKASIKVTIVSPGATRTEIIPPAMFAANRTRDEILDPEDIAKGCISILGTPEHVSISECIIEPLHPAVFDP